MILLNTGEPYLCAKSGRSANAGIGRGVRLARPSHKPRPGHKNVSTQARVCFANQPYSTCAGATRKRSEMKLKPAASLGHPRAALRTARNVLWLVVVAGVLVKASDEGNSPPADQSAADGSVVVKILFPAPGQSEWHPDVAVQVERPQAIQCGRDSQG